MNRVSITTLIVSLTIFSQSLSALAVIDKANLRENVAQVAYILEEIKNQDEQIGQLAELISQAERNYRAVTGISSLSDTLSVPAVHDMLYQLPLNQRVLLKRIAKGDLPDDVKELNDTLGALLDLYDMAEKDSINSTYVERQDRINELEKEIRANHVVNNAAAEQALTSTKANGENIAELNALINQTETLKQSLDLNSRIQIENANIMNQLLYIQALSMQRETQIAINSEQQRELNRLTYTLD